MKFIIEKVSNMVFITSDCGVIFKAWNVEDFTDRKMNNAMNKIKKNYTGEVTFTKTF